jgi:hypothetical protein
MHGISMKHNIGFHYFLKIYLFENVFVPPRIVFFLSITICQSITVVFWLQITELTNQLVHSEGLVIQNDTTQLLLQTFKDTRRRSKEEAVCSTFMYAYGVDLISSWLTGSTLG